MFSYIYNSLIYQPLYNGLVFLMDIIPWADAGIAIIVLTLIVKLILFPLSKKAITTQLRMKGVEPELALIKEKYKEDKQEQARQTMGLYKKQGINPFSSILLIFIQLPVIFALYKVFLSSGLPSINTDLLYHFISVPAIVNIKFLNLIDIAGKSLILAIIAGVSTYIQIRFSLPPKPKVAPATGSVPTPTSTSKTSSFKDDLARSMNIQMRYIFPVLAFFISWSISGAIALYWITSNIFTIGQEIVIRRGFKSKM